MKTNTQKHASSWRSMKALLAVMLALFTFSVARGASAQDDPEPGDDDPLPDVAPKLLAPGTPGSNADFAGSVQVLRGPAGSGPSSRIGIEIFPDASRVWMTVRDTDPVAVERARRGGNWACSKGGCSAQPGTTAASAQGDAILRSIKVQTPTVPLPLTIWGRRVNGRPVLDFDPVLLGRRSYSHVCAYPPIFTSETSTPPDASRVESCRDQMPQTPTPDSGELVLGMAWPQQAELADFRYLAIVDSCGNARVQPFQRVFTAPVYHVASGGCGKPDGKVLRVFPQGGFLRVTAFNLETPAAGDVMNVTYRVTLPALENFEDSNPAKLLFPDFRVSDLKVDCGPPVRRSPTDMLGVPRAPPPSAMPAMPPGDRPNFKKTPNDKLPGDKPPSDKPPGEGPPTDKPPGDTPSEPPPDKPPTDKPDASSLVPTTPEGRALAANAKAKAPEPIAPRMVPARPEGPPPLDPNAVDPDAPGPRSLDNGSVVISPDPLRLGNCRVTLGGQTKRRLVAPLALHVALIRTDKTQSGVPLDLIPEGKGTWIVTPGDAEFQLPALRENFDGDSRLRLIVFSDPLSGDGKVVLLSDATRVATALRATDGDPERARRAIGSVTIHAVPLCGESNFESLDQAGSCLRAYLTLPAMLATLQLTRAPWVEKPLITRTVLNAVGIAMAFDSYDPVERRAFPVAGQVGGFVETLGDGKVGLMAYLGVAPTLPILGSGGNTTSIGFLAGAGIMYITNEAGPDEGLKPTAFLSFVVQVGQASPEFSFGGSASASSE